MTFLSSTASAPANLRGTAIRPADFRAVAPSTATVPGVRVPSIALEWWYYAQVFYAIFGAVLGLSVGLVGAGMLALLAIACVLHMGKRVLALLLPLALPLAFGVTYFAVQVLFFQESPLHPDVRLVISWLLGTVVIQCLALRRGFLDRFVVFAGLLALGTIPFMTLYRGSQTRVGLASGIGIANPNDLGAWCGFCALYAAILSIETRRPIIRLMAVAAATGAIFVMALTVSRGPLFALALAGLVAFRRVFKRGFFALLPMVVAAWIAYGTGVFDQSAALYESRGLEDSGRFLVWPLAISRFLEHPLSGVGVSEIGTYVAEKGQGISPHNQFIFVALAGGLFPLGFFVAYWISLIRSVAKLRVAAPGEAVFLVPLLLYTFLIGLQLNQPYMMPWSMVTAGSVAAHAFAMKARQHVTRGGALPPVTPHEASTRFHRDVD